MERNKSLLFRIIFLVSLIVIASCLNVIIDTYQAQYAAELAVDQMETESSLAYTTYHKTIQELETIRSYIRTGLIVYTVYFSGSFIISKIKKIKEKF